MIAGTGVLRQQEQVNGNVKAMEAQEILEHIDSCQGVLPFLSNDGRQHLADTRLTVFRSPDDWAIFVEIPHYCTGNEDFLNWVGGAGTCLIEGDCTRGEEFYDKSLFEEVTDAPLWKLAVKPDDHWKTWIGDRARFSIMFKGERHDFMPNDADYAAAGIGFRDKRTGPGSIEPGCLLRFLCHHLGHPFFASEDDLRSLLHNSPDLEVFIQTRHWQHPVYLADGDDEFFEEHYICNIPCFQILSRAIASGDLTEWNNQNPAMFNTHWGNLEAIRHEFEENLNFGTSQFRKWIIPSPEDAP